MKKIRLNILVRFNRLSGININNAIIKVIIEIVRLKELDNTMLSILIFLFFNRIKWMNMWIITCGKTT